MSKVYRQPAKSGKRFKCFPAWMDRRHNWIRLDRKSKIVTLKETPFGRFTTQMSVFRCLVCGKEEWEEDDKYVSKEEYRRWTLKPTPEDTTKELFDVPS